MEIQRSTLRQALGCAAAIAFLSSSTARADFYLHAWENQHEDRRWLTLDGTLNFYGTSQNFNSDGSRVAPPTLTSYKQINLEALARYGFSERVSGFARLSWARVSVESTPLTGDAYGLNDQSAGLNVRLMDGDVKLDLQGQVDFAPYNNENAREDKIPFLGDGSTDITGGGFLTFTLLTTDDARILTTLGTGYTYRTSDFSSAIPYSALANLVPRKSGLLATFGFVGMQSLQTDSQPGATAEGGDSSGTGGSFMSNAVNPSQLRIRAGLGWKFESETDMRLRLQGELAVHGTNSPAGSLVTLGFQMRLPGSGAANTPETESNTRSRKKKNHEIGTTGFLSYSLEAKVLAVNDRLHLVRINKGQQSNVEVGQLFDIFSAKPDGTVTQLVARAKVTDVKEEEAALEISEYYKETWIDQGFIAKRVTPQ